MAPRPGIAPLVGMGLTLAAVESPWACATPAPKSHSRATTLAARAREFMLGQLRGMRKRVARFGRRGTLGGALVGCQRRPADACAARSTRRAAQPGVLRERGAGTRLARGHAASPAGIPPHPPAIT